ncbi:hypothetical protein JNUCC1_01502 [Lentibacillus sp. JNUCC-1]|uniref:alpha/beta fold hydrolase n=1 Tax=Lentibacillus sp. JNUCC-1 TaxID=2654513 RepID=UPI0013251C02|nr:hypothetical protein [Lentibacillus sp. JNUCC-1]
MVQEAYDTHNYAFLRQLWDMLIYTGQKPDEERYQKYLEDMTTQRNLAECYHALNVFNISSHPNGLVPGEDKVRQIDIPVMITRGDQDLVVTKDMTDELREDYGDRATYHEFTGSGHSPLIDDREELIHVLDEFLKQ